VSAGDEFRIGKKDEALRVTFNYFIGAGSFEQMTKAEHLPDAEHSRVASSDYLA
jgi:hypothetical protein